MLKSSKITINLLLILSTLSFSGCGLIVYRPDVQQGNVIVAEKVQRLRIGMRPAEVHEIMGSPVLVNTFMPSRFNYVYTFQNRRGPRIESRVIVYFNHMVVSRIETDL